MPANAAERRVSYAQALCEATESEMARDANVIVAGLGVGLLLALFLCGLGLAISTVARSNRTALSVGLFVLIALFFPTQLPTSARTAAFGDFLLRADPITAGLHYLGQLVGSGHAVGDDIHWLVGPVSLAVAAGVAALWLGNRMTLRAGSRA